MSDNIYSIYLIRCLVNEKLYIGFTHQSGDTRWKEHIFNASSGNNSFILHKAIRKYGSHNFTFEILHTSNDGEFTHDYLEEYYIREYKSHYLDGHGYNMTYGGEGMFGYKHTEETKQKMKDKAFRSKNWLKTMKSYKITYEDGRVEVIKGLRLFCKEHNYSQILLSKLLTNRIPRKRHKDIVKIEYYLFNES